MNKTTGFIIALLFLTFSAFSKAGFSPAPGKLFFIENKGQITDQHSLPRNDIQYALNAPGINIFIGNGQLHYQFYKLKLKHTDLPGYLKKQFKDHKPVDTHEQLATVETYRMDVELVGANKYANVTATEKQAYYENYYLANSPQEGYHAGACGKITYRNVYNDIDWVIYIKDNKLEHEFVVGPNGNAADIKLKYSGHTSLTIKDNGSIVAATPMGIINEHAPVCFRPSGKEIASSYQLNNNILSYNVEDTKNVIIDPTVQWATYYGPDSNNTSFYGMICDATANIYADGLTWSPTTGNIATAGAFQVTYGGGCDAFLVKFDSSGNRIWGTFYGGANGDWANDLTISTSSSLYMLGTSNSTTGIATAGTQQTTLGGGYDAFLAKFNTAGMRIWGTYAGGTAADYPETAKCDPVNRIYISGTADSYTGIATAGSHMPARAGGHDNFLIQYDSLGVRQWGTYYGGTSDEFGGVVSCDASSVCLAGYTYSTSGITTPSAHQPVHGGACDVYIARFTSGGARMWGSYYGGVESELTGNLMASNGALYLLGSTGSTTGIATAGAYQAAWAGSQDAFLLKINPDLSHVIWGTYFGGPGDDAVDYSRMCADGHGDIYITGLTTSTSGIASPGAFHTTHGGGDYDAFFAKFSPIGTLYWSTYYGGTSTDLGKACAFDGLNAYLAGQTVSPDNIATPGAFLSTGGSGPFYPQGFIVKFIITDTSIVTLSAASKNIPTASISIYPNPNNGSFTLTGSDISNGNVQLTVLDITGKTILNDQAVVANTSLSKQITLPQDAAPGVYFIRAVSQSQTTVLRFVKE
ncbi:MAG: hypothetical protein K0Q79_380 [Flavipsychrobacter sp.]|jgi:hypothetical protein|nr:hypothetical protein [Flavipsychrobacter sp.]